jgi:translation initiation factor 2 subunit 1
MRLHNNIYPNVDDIVICRVKKILNDAIYVSLLEYDNIEGMVQLANASTRRKKRSICLLKENKQYPLLVITVDKEKGYIDLSNKYLAEDDKNDANENYTIYQRVIKIFKEFMFQKFGKEYTEDQYINYATKSIWKLDKKKCYNLLTSSYFNNTILDFELDESDKNIFNNCIRSHCGNFEISSKLNFTLRNPNYGGVDLIKTLFNKIFEKYNLNIKINDVPSYNIEIISNDKLNNENLLNEVNDLLSNESEINKMIYSKKEIISNILKV